MAQNFGLAMLLCMATGCGGDDPPTPASDSGTPASDSGTMDATGDAPAADTAASGDTMLTPFDAAGMPICRACVTNTECAPFLDTVCVSERGTRVCRQNCTGVGTACAIAGGLGVCTDDGGTLYCALPTCVVNPDICRTGQRCNPMSGFCHCAP